MTYYQFMDLADVGVEKIKDHAIEAFFWQWKNNTLIMIFLSLIFIALCIVIGVQEEMKDRK